MLNDHSPVFQLSLCANTIAKQSVFPQNQLRNRESYAHEAREPHTPIGLALCFQPRSRPICLTARAYLNTQKYGLFCSLCKKYIFVNVFCVESYVRVKLLKV